MKESFLSIKVKKDTERKLARDLITHIEEHMLKMPVNISNKKLKNSNKTYVTRKATIFIT